MTPPLPQAESKGEILIVEDTPASLELLSELLTGAGYAVRQAPDGELALWTARLRPPELILLDIRMPGLDGFEVCRRLKADPTNAATPVIFLSALDAIEDKVQGLSLGAADYITKPYQPEEVLARVNTHITLARLHKALDEERELLEQRVRERTATLEAERREMSRVLTALDMAGDGIAILSQDNRITYANQAMVGTIGLGRLEELLGHTSEDIVIGGTPIFDAAEIRLARDAVHRLGWWSGELTLHLPSQNRPHRILAHLRALPDGGRVAVLTDVTEARQREDEKRRLESQLEQARKLEALGQLTAGVAHDFNNLLGAILGFAQFIVEDTAEDSPLHRYGTRIVKAGQQAKSLIGQILAFSNRRDAAFEVFDLCALIDENMNILRAIVPPTTTLDVRTEVEEPAIAGHRSQITQVLVNLTVNASEALQGGPGTVTIEVGDADLAAPSFQQLRSALAGETSLQSPIQSWTGMEGRIHAGFGHLQPEMRYLRLTVSDTGEGMDADTVSRVFDPFFTTKGKTGGTGLGLAVVHGAVASHGGAVLLTSVPGRGSRFDILLPMADGLGQGDARSSSPLPVAHKGSILLVEDSSEFGDMLMTALFRLGYEISVCDNPVDALGYVREDPAAWDMVITDQAMPAMTGAELVSGIKTIRPDLPCIICTAFPDDIAQEKAYQAGANGFATKPLDIGHFSVMVRDLICGDPPVDPG
ncbi:response regulator protein [Paramagnetospirillum caucaseum]|uniref:histidine kinase n=1 Tax=Paramagnetospirillum caucaseum TaxID=1244869 RepID=M2ZMZ2_9PROT|nr:response regulator [Paramagnetospirillum caucaseum]EME68652.1 response regulator protein [Paramagnetospirillum caucaseum]